MNLVARLMVLFAHLLAGVSLAGEMVSQERWRDHLEDDLLPFWNHPDAHGDPVGMFPSYRCNDGTRVDLAAPCIEVGAIGGADPDVHFTSSISRQTFAYGVSFHMTGDRHYLDLAKSGVDVLMGPARDGENGGHFAAFDSKQATWGPSPKSISLSAQAQALLGPSFYYFLTRDPDVLAFIRQTRATMIEAYRSGDGSGYTRLRADGELDPGSTGHLGSYLEQLAGSYQIVAPLLAEAERSEWVAEMHAIAKLVRTRFYAPRHNVFLVNLDRQTGAGLTPPKTSFGQTFRAFRFLMIVGVLAGDDEMVAFARENGRALLSRSIRMRIGAWSNGIGKNGKLSDRKVSWVFAEQNRFAALLAVDEPKMAKVLHRTHAFWLGRFVDHQFGGVLPVTVGKRRKIQIPLPKHAPRKAAYHTFEHALIAYLSAAGVNQRPVPVFFAFAKAPAPESLRPYIFFGEVERLEEVGNSGVQQVTFINISFLG